MADLEIVQPVADARRVNFDYGAASAAIDAVTAMGSRVSGQADGRVGAQTHVVVNWKGTFRTEFDEAVRLLNARFDGLVEAGGGVKRRIYDAVDDANALQRSYNRKAQTTGGQGPHGAV